MTYSADQVRSIVRRVLTRTLGPDGIEKNPGAGSLPTSSGQTRPTVTEASASRKVAPGVGPTIIFSHAIETVSCFLARIIAVPDPHHNVD